MSYKKIKKLKFDLVETEINLPGAERLLNAEAKENSLVLYVLYDLSNSAKKLELKLVPTDTKIEGLAGWVYRSTVYPSFKFLAWHIFERSELKATGTN
tara:strand:- start:5758 stop:6051 length:294 start_codon:yes stop_codon:yes gene_type:complete